MTQEQRTILAIVLMTLVFMLSQYFFPLGQETPPPADKPAAAKRAEAPAQQPAPPAPPPALQPAPAKTPPAAAPQPQSPKPRPPQRLATVEGPLYRAVVSSEGGKLQELMLRYRGEKPMVIVGDLGPGGLLVGSEPGRVEPVPMELSAESLTLGPERATQDLVLTAETDGLRIRQTLTFSAAAYTVETKVRIENAGSAPRGVAVVLPWATRQAWKETKEKFIGQHPTEIVWSTGGHIAREENLCEVHEVAASGEWVAAGSIWYMAALIPRTDGFKLVARAGDKKVCDATGKEPAGRATVAVQATPTLAPGQAWEGRVTVFVGPKEYGRLKALGLESTINFGGFPLPKRWGGLPMEWLGVPILLLMNWVYAHVGNYGIAIILLTVLSKVLFYPLTVKSIRSMKAMQALQPQVNALRNKHKSDPPRMQREMMELYKKHKVNPMGGCLPMVAQVPIFYALYLALSVAVELQNAAFLCFGRVPAWVPFLGGTDLWICDLANYDPTYVLPLLMGVTMFVQQKMTPVAGDPRQARMMLMMPFVFTFMFFNLPSGLVLYWTVSNVLQILQQWYMDRHKAEGAAREAKDAGRA